MPSLSFHDTVFLAVKPVDFRRGIDGLVAVCRQQLGVSSMTDAVFVFRNRRANAVKVLWLDANGYWLCLHRLSRGKLAFWPQAADNVVSMSCQNLQALLVSSSKRLMPPA